MCHTLTPIECGDFCPYRQKQVFGYHIEDMLTKKLIVPVENMTQYYSQLRRDYGYIGYYNFICTEWNMSVENELHYVVMNTLHDMIDIDEAILAYTDPDPQPLNNMSG